MSLFNPVVVNGKVRLSILSDYQRAMRIHFVDVAVTNVDNTAYEIRSIAYECRLQSCPICERSTNGFTDEHVRTVDMEAIVGLDYNDNCRPVILDSHVVANAKSICGFEIEAKPDLTNIEVVKHNGIAVGAWECSDLAVIDDWENAENVLDYSLHSLLDAKLCKYTIDSRL